jgi:uncharacterized phiE125 gp8 family phage protein
MPITRLPITGTAPPEPITLTEAKAQLRITCPDEDTFTTALIAVVRTDAENRLQRSLVPTAWRLTLDAFPAFPQIINLSMVPVVSITAIGYHAEDGTIKTLASNAWLLDAYSSPARLAPAVGTRWPTDISDRPGAVWVEYTAGYATPADVPTPIKQWMLLAMGDLDSQRARSSEKPAVPQHFADALLDVYRVWSY